MFLAIFGEFFAQSRDCSATFFFRILTDFVDVSTTRVYWAANANGRRSENAKIARSVAQFCDRCRKIETFSGGYWISMAILHLHDYECRLSELSRTEKQTNSDFNPGLLGPESNVLPLRHTGFGSFI